MGSMFHPRVADIKLTSLPQYVQEMREVESPKTKTKETGKNKKNKKKNDNQKNIFSLQLYQRGKFYSECLQLINNRDLDTDHMDMDALLITVFLPPPLSVQVTDIIPFTSEIMQAGIHFARKSMGGPYACLHVRGGDSFFAEGLVANLE